MLNLRDLWPDVPMLGYMEFYYQHDKADVGFDPEFPGHLADYPRIRAKNAINHIALNLGGVDKPRHGGNCRPTPPGRSKTLIKLLGGRRSRRMQPPTRSGARSPQDWRCHDQADR